MSKKANKKKKKTSQLNSSESGQELENDVILAAENISGGECGDGDGANSNNNKVATNSNSAVSLLSSSDNNGEATNTDSSGSSKPATATTSSTSIPSEQEMMVRQSSSPDQVQNSFNFDELRKAMKLLQLNNTTKKPPRTKEEAMSRNFEFWSTQPVPKMNEEITSNEPIEPDVPIDMIRKEPYSLPDGFHWDTLDLNDPLVLKELYNLLCENYVEDDDCLFRFDYPPDFLIWALKPPGWKLEWHAGVRVTKNKKLIGFISAIPATIKIHDKTMKIVEINFLCVHKKLRSKRVAPVLIREITRRVNMHGIFQACYTAGVVLPKPISTCRYWHRSLNPKKLIETKFSHLTRNMTISRTVKLFRLPDEPKCNLLRPMTKKDLPGAHALLSNYLKKFKLAPEFDLKEFEHWVLPRPNIIDSYVVERDEVITDLVSFYTLPSTVVNNPIHKSIKAAYAFYNVATSMKLQDLMQDALILARDSKFDVFNALDLMENKNFLENLKFGVGDGNLQYYLYNWKCPSVGPSDIGLVLQ